MDHLHSEHISPKEMYLEKIIPLLQPRAGTIKEMAEMAMFFLVEDHKLDYDQKAVQKFLTPEIRRLLSEIASRLEKLDSFDQEALEQDLGEYIRNKEIKFKVIAQPLRVAITGKTASPGLFETMEVLGRERVVNRLKLMSS